nr:LCP family protein [Propionibacterium sp.]
MLALVALVVYLIAVPVVAWSGLGHADYAPRGSRPADQPGTLLLLAGSDSREGLTVEQQGELGTGSEGGNVADTIMLLYLPASGRPALVSLPRDSYVAIPGHGRNKINAAFALGGPTLLTATVEQATGLRVDGFLEIGFGGFVGIIDALGGIEQCPTYDIKDEWAHLDLKKGCQTMDGVTALKYVRMRHADPLGDLGRVQRQRGMVTAVAKKALSPWVVLNPVTYWQLNRAGAAALTAGTGTGLPQIAPAALGFWSISRGDGLTLTVPVSDVDLKTPVGSVVQWDKAKSTRLFELIARGDTAGLDQFKS